MNAKQLIALLVMAIFMVGVAPLAFAGKETVKIGGDAGVKVSGDAAVESDAEAEAGADAADTEANAKSKEKIVIKSGDDVVKVVTKAEEKAGTKIKVEVAKQKFRLARENYFETREKLTELKAKLKECKEDDTSDMCEKRREEFNAHAKVHIENLLEAAIEKMAALRARVEASTELTAEEKTALLARIDEHVAALQQTSADIKTKAELKESVKLVKEAWKEAKPVAQLSAEKETNARLGNVLEKTEKLETRFITIKEKLAAQGKDTAKLDAALAGFSAKLSTANEHYLKARELFSEALKADNPQPLMKSAHEEQRLALDAVKEAKKMLHDLVKEIKAQDGFNAEAKKEAKKAEKAQKEADEDKGEIKETVREGVTFELKTKGTLSAEVTASMEKLAALVKALAPEVEVEVKYKNNVLTHTIEGTVTAEVKAAVSELKAAVEKAAQEVEIEMELSAEEEANAEEKAEVKIKEEVSPGVFLKVETEGAVTADMQATIDQLVALMKAATPPIEIEVEVKEGKTVVETEGAVTAEMKSLADTLGTQAEAAGTVEVELKLVAGAE